MSNVGISEPSRARPRQLSLVDLLQLAAMTFLLTGVLWQRVFTYDIQAAALSAVFTVVVSTPLAWWFAEHWLERKLVAVLLVLVLAIPVTMAIWISPLNGHLVIIRNRSNGAACCRAAAEAQEIYRWTDWDGDAVREYAQTITEFTTKYKSCLLLVDRAFINADLTNPQVTPRQGFVFLVLKGQGASAHGGRQAYVDVNGNMTGGFAFVACPAPYRYRGQYTFMTNHDGVVFQKDLGPDTLNIVKQMTEFNPDSTWVEAE